MAGAALTAFWILPPSPRGSHGFGVTAWSLDDALRFIRAQGYGATFPPTWMSCGLRRGSRLTRWTSRT
jgi:hypothetical protein